MESESTDDRSKVINAIKEIEHNAMLFTKEELFNHVHGMSEADFEEVFHDLLDSGYIYLMVGTDGLYSRHIWKDYSHAQEDSSIGV